MYPPHSIVFFVLSLLALANPMAQPPTPRGVSAPITKGNKSLPVDHVEISNASEAKRTVKKFETGITAHRNNTNMVYPRFKTYGIIPLDRLPDPHGTIYAGTLEFGEPPKPLSLIVTTGGADLVVRLCAHDTDPSDCEWYTTQIYHPDSSETNRVGGYCPQYVDGTVVFSPQYFDDITISKKTDLIARSQAICAMKRFPISVPVTAAGYLGLGLLKASKMHQPSITENLNNENQLSYSMFGLRLSSNPNTPSELFIGGLNSDLYDKNRPIVWITTPDLGRSGQWLLLVSSIKVGGEELTGLPKIIGMLESATPLIYGERTIITALYAQITGSISAPDLPGYYYIPCPPATGSGKDVTFVFSGKGVTIPYSIFSAGNAGILKSPNLCIGGAVAHPEPPPVQWMILGNKLMENAYFGFDLANKHIGIADLPSP